ncbi:hypothetical protein HCN44_005746 [Aphidius gifuensis]|uniref:Gustatory receptor n=1 Tax=Aphidius gifuensis TaxID=684658 RepID=A0A834XVN4_APHGI|nr:hypothetical protein HCN44_005746 [Aphidius gifuensis]
MNSLKKLKNKNLSVYYYHKLLGLCPFILMDNEIYRASICGIIYTFILCIIYTHIYIRVVIRRFSFILPSETPMSTISDFIGITFDYLITISIWLIVIFRQNQLSKILNCFKNNYLFLKKIGIYEDYEMIYCSFRNWTFIINFAYYALLICDHAVLSMYTEFDLIIWAPLNFLRVITHDFIVLYSISLIIVKNRYTSINEFIKKLSFNLQQRNADYEKSLDLLKLLGPLHANLTNLLKLLESFFMIPIIFSLGSHFVQLTSCLYIVLMYMINNKVWSIRFIGSFVSTTSWFIFHSVEIIILIIVASTTCNEGNKIGINLHKLLINCTNERLSNLVKILSLRLLQQPVSFTLYGFIDLNAALLYQVINFVIFFILLIKYTNFNYHLIRKNYGLSLTINWILLTMPKMLQVLSTTIFSCLVILLANYFSTLNKQLKVIVNKANNYNIEIIGNPDVIAENIRQTSQIHYDLCKISKFLNHKFNGLLIITVTTAFAILSSTFYFIFVEVQSAHYTDLNRIGIYVSWQIIHAYPVVVTVIACNWASNQATHTGELIHKINVEKTDTKLYQTIQSFALQLHHQKVEFSGACLFPINSKLLQSMIAHVTTSLVILIQFQPSIE